jgi:uncharacterized protein with HEPN domain
MKDDRVYLLHIQDAVQRVLAYTRDGRDYFLADTKTQDAVIRNIEIIGEATKNLSQDRKAAHPGVPWKQIAGMRDTLIHRYFGVKLELVWQVVESDLPFRRRLTRSFCRARLREQDRMSRGTRRNASPAGSGLP